MCPSTQTRGSCGVYSWDVERVPEASNLTAIWAPYNKDHLAPSLKGASFLCPKAKTEQPPVMRTSKRRRTVMHYLAQTHHRHNTLCL